MGQQIGYTEAQAQTPEAEEEQPSRDVPPLEARPPHRLGHLAGARCECDHARDPILARRQRHLRGHWHCLVPWLTDLPSDLLLYLDVLYCRHQV